MDILTFLELADQLGGAAAEAKRYDEIVLTLGHVGRLQNIEKTEASFPGIKIVSSPLIPEGYGVLKNSGKVVGVINFMDGSALTIPPPDAINLHKHGGK